jgi:hypothetical protein
MLTFVHVCEVPQIEVALLYCDNRLTEQALGLVYVRGCDLRLIRELGLKREQRQQRTGRSKEN